MKPLAPARAQPDWFVCHCGRSQPFAPPDELGGVTIEEAEAFGWAWVDDEQSPGWLCPLHSGKEIAAHDRHHRPREHPTLVILPSFLMTVAVSFAAIAFRAAALAWVWGHFVGTLWPRAPHVQAWQFFGLLVLRPLVEKGGRDDEEDLLLSERLQRQRERVFSSVAGTALSWATVWLLLRLFG